MLSGVQSKLRMPSRGAQSSKPLAVRGKQQPPTRSRATTAEEEVVQTSTEDSVSSTAHLVEFRDGVYTVEGAFSTPAPATDVWDVLTDYERLAEVFSNIKRSEVVSRAPEVVLHQDCKWEFLIFSGSFGTQLSVKEDRPALVLTFELIRSSFMRSFVGQWRLEPQKVGSGTRVCHKLAIEPVISPPAFMSGYTQKIFVQQVASILRDLECEMHGHGAGEFQYSDL